MYKDRHILQEKGGKKKATIKIQDTTSRETIQMIH